MVADIADEAGRASDRIKTAPRPNINTVRHLRFITVPRDVSLWHATYSSLLAQELAEYHARNLERRATPSWTT
jgi:hypothetical protein